MASPSPSPPLSPEALKIEQLTRQLQWAELKIQALEERLRLERIRKYGPKSEKLSDNQMQLLELEPGVSAEEVEAESRREPLPAASLTTTKSKDKKHPGRQELPASLPRVERMIPCTPEQCVCKNCGKDNRHRLRAERTARRGAHPLLRCGDPPREASLP